MMQITIHPTGELIACNYGDNLLKVLVEAGIFIDNPCNGGGTCGKCKVRILPYSVPPQTQATPSDSECRFLSEDDMASGLRLACMTTVTGNITVEIPYKYRKHEILTAGYLPDFDREFRKSGYGIVIDIGTTTVVAALIDLTTGEELGGASMINAQKTYGSDVLTRITYECENPDTGAGRLQKTIIDSLNAMIGEICLTADVERTEIVEIAAAANCTMLHMLLGADARPLGKAPYTPLFTEAQTLYAKDIGLQTGDNTVLYCLPSVSTYIGADIVAGAYVCGLKEQTGNVLFIDIGTNGEIVLAHKGRLLCCSCAAGPALEGMNISAGMRAADGAIEDVSITPDGIELTVIGGKSPEGLCGSGILAVVRELLRTGIVKKQGVFIKPDSLKENDFRSRYIRMNGTKREFILHEHPDLLVTQGDVRQVQLAKGALLSGFIVLLKEAGLYMEELDRVMIAGQFGAHLPAASIVGTGILPAGLKEKIVYVGNTAKTGAYMAVMSRKAKREIEELAKRMEYLELAQTENYERIFTESMVFPEL